MRRDDRPGDYIVDVHYGTIDHLRFPADFPESLVKAIDLAVQAWLLAQRAASQQDVRPCTCHPDDNPPRPCPRKYALSECRAAAPATECRTITEVELRGAIAYLELNYELTASPREIAEMIFDCVEKGRAVQQGASPDA